MSHPIPSSHSMRKVHPFFMNQSLFRATIAPALGSDAGRECVEHYLRGRSREAALADWDAGRTSDPPLDWGYSSDVNLALQDYLRRTSSPIGSASSQHSPANDPRVARTSSRTCPAEVPCAIVIAVHGSGKAPGVVYDTATFPGCGARCAADAPGPDQTRGDFRVKVELDGFARNDRALLMLMRAEQIARLGRVLDAPRNAMLPDFHQGLDDILRDTRPLRDASEAHAILVRLAREFAELEDVRRKSGEGKTLANDEERLSVDAAYRDRVSVPLRRYFWLVSLLASIPVFDGLVQAGRSKSMSMFEADFHVEPNIRFPSSDLYCVLMVDC